MRKNVSEYVILIEIYTMSRRDREIGREREGDGGTRERKKEAMTCRGNIKHHI